MNGLINLLINQSVSQLCEHLIIDEEVLLSDKVEKRSMEGEKKESRTESEKEIESKTVYVKSKFFIYISVYISHQNYLKNQHNGNVQINPSFYRCKRTECGDPAAGWKWYLFVHL